MNITIGKISFGDGAKDMTRENFDLAYGTILSDKGCDNVWKELQKEIEKEFGKKEIDKGWDRLKDSGLDEPFELPEDEPKKDFSISLKKKKSKK